VQTAIPATLMRGGTSKGLYFQAQHLPVNPSHRNAVLMAAMGSPDERQIDGLGGAHPLTSKIAIIAPSTRADSDVEYLFLQVSVDKAEVSDSQNCGNLLAGVGPFAIECGLIRATDPVTPVRIYMVNTGALACAFVQTPSGIVEYDGETRIDGVPGTAAPIPIEFLDVAGSSCGALFPTGQVVDTVLGTKITCIDNGMPVVILSAHDFGLTGEESPEDLEGNAELKARIEAIRLTVGPMMNLGDVTKKTIPKMTLVSPALNGGAISTRTFIPHRVHEAIGVLGAVSVATALAAPGSVAAQHTASAHDNGVRTFDIEHPTGFFSVEIDLTVDQDQVTVHRSALLRTARKLMAGEVFVPGNLVTP